MKRNLLIVDDDINSIEVLRHIFSKENYAITTAMDGKSGMEQIALKKPDIMILDVNLPDTLGTDLCMKIKSQDDNKDIIIILLSGVKISEEDKLFGLEIGATDYITRPFVKSELVAKVNALINLKYSLVQPRNQEALSDFGNSKANITASAFEQIDVQRDFPDVFNDFVSEYESLLDKQIEKRIYKVNSDYSEQIKKNAFNMGAYNFGPKDIIKLHKKVIDKKGRNKTALNFYYIKEEGSILLIETLGYLLMYYRSKI